VGCGCVATGWAEWVALGMLGSAVERWGRGRQCCLVRGGARRRPARFWVWVTWAAGLHDSGSGQFGLLGLGQKCSVVVGVGCAVWLAGVGAQAAAVLHEVWPSGWVVWAAWVWWLGMIASTFGDHWVGVRVYMRARWLGAVRQD